ncbi:MAG: hypothetical protein AB1728_12305 [Bacteroidota bacterium]
MKSRSNHKLTKAQSGKCQPPIIHTLSTGVVKTGEQQVTFPLKMVQYQFFFRYILPTTEDAMHIAKMSSRGRLTIPVRLRKRLRLTRGTKVSVFELEGNIHVRKIDKDYVSQFAGILGTKGKAVKGLMRERRSERSL